MQVRMSPAKQLDLTLDIFERGFDHRVQSFFMPIDNQRADLQQIELPIAAYGEFHVDSIARQKSFKLIEQSNDRSQRRRTGVRP